MAFERLGSLLEELVVATPFDHPDREYYVRLQERHNLHGESSARQAQLSQFEGRKIIAKTEADRKRMIDGIVPVVSELFVVKPEDIMGVSRLKECMRPRFATSYLLHMVGNKGASEIARFYGGKDHTTVLNHIARARELMETDELFAETISLAEERLMQLVSVSQKPTNGLSYGQR